MKSELRKIFKVSDFGINMIAFILYLTGAIIMFLIGIYCIIKPNNFLLPYLYFSEYDKSVKKKYGHKTAVLWMRIFGIVVSLIAVMFILAILQII